MKNIGRIKREWQEHNRDYGLTWNEVAMLVNQVNQHPTEPTRPSVEEANKIVEENFKGLNDLIEDADFRQFYKSLISDCMVDFATQHHTPTDFNNIKVKETVKFNYALSKDEDGAVVNYLNEKHSAGLAISETSLLYNGEVFSKHHTQTEKDQPMGAKWINVIQNERLIQKLGQCYRRDNASRLVVATLCDDYLDKSGALLGKVREYANNNNTEKAQPKSAEEWLKCHPVKLIYNEDIQESTIRLIDVAPLLEQYKLIK